jgi:hypothetical protein
LASALLAKAIERGIAKITKAERNERFMLKPPEKERCGNFDDGAKRKGEEVRRRDQPERFPIC